MLSNMANAKWMWFTSYVFTSTYGEYVPTKAALDTSRFFDTLQPKMVRDAAEFPDYPSTTIGPSDPDGLTTLTDNRHSAFAMRSVCCAGGE